MMWMITPDMKTVSKLSKKYTYIPLYEKVPLKELQVPMMYEQFRGPYTCVFELQDEVCKKQYSFIGIHGKKRFTSDGQTSYLYDGDLKKLFQKDPMKVVAELIKEHSPILPELPFFTGGAVGHINYDTIRLYEEINDKDKESLHLPLMQFMFIDELLVIDEKEGYIYILVNIKAEKYESEYTRASQRIHQIKQELATCKEEKASVMMYHECSSNMSEDKFINMVTQAKEYIKQGDIFQVVLSQRFESKYEEDPFLAYKKIRKMGCSPYLYYLDFDDYCIAGMSPEMLLKCEGKQLQTMPIAGTRKRGKDTKEDEQLIQELKEDQKEVSEHMMLVDLSRNDIGRVALVGSVQVENIKEVQLYSHVMHMTTRVHAILDEHKSAYDALISLFPAGTLSGAPKVRAMQIIDELEDTRREVYGGVIAFLGYQGKLDTCIAIRTLLFYKQKVYIQAGAGIVKDSDPQKEYVETLQKGSALLQSLGCEVIR